MYAIRILRTTRGVMAAALCSLAWGGHLCAQTELDFIARRDSKVTGRVVTLAPCRCCWAEEMGVSV
jgi:hypothetical protein